MNHISREEADIFLAELEEGRVRAAYLKGDEWVVDSSVKEKILAIFKSSPVSIAAPMTNRADSDENAEGCVDSYYIDKEWVPARKFSVDSGIRIVPGGSSIRRGAYIGKKCVIMPPSYVNIGAYVGEGSMVDSNALVGSCAQVGRSVHISAGVQIGGVLEPISAKPVIIEDECFLGAGAKIVESVLIRKGAVLAPGVILSGSTKIYDVVKKEVYLGEVPAGAVVVPGSRSLGSGDGESDFCQGLATYAPIIVKYRDARTNASVAIEEALR